MQKRKIILELNDWEYLLICLKTSENPTLSLRENIRKQLDNP